MTAAKLIQAALLMLSLPVLPMAQQAEAEVRSRIEGLVVKAASDEPLAGATVLLRRDGAGAFEKEYGTNTGSDGRFVLKDIPRGRYLLSASKSGFVSQQYGQKQPHGTGAILDLTTSQTLRDVTVAMPAGGVISGRVSDQDGQPVEGTVIRAFQRRYQRDGSAALSEVNATVTNDIGEYRMYWLAPGTYYLLAIVLPNRSSPNPALETTVIDQSIERPDSFGPTFFPSGDDDAQATPIRIEAGSEIRAVDFSLTRTKALRVKGRVVNNATGQPVADAAIEMKLKYADIGPRSFGLATHSDGGGEFEFRNAPPGQYMLSARWTEPGFRTMFTEQNVQVGVRDIEGIQVRLQANRGISGRLIMERGEPLPADRTLLLFTQSDGTSFGTGAESDGTFSLSNVSTGLLRVELTGFPENFFIRSARAAGKDVLRDGLSMADISDSVEITVASQGGTVQGEVQDDRQSPAVGARVVLMPNSERRDRPDMVRAVITDQYGRFAIRGVVPADYKIFAWESLEPNIYFDPAFIEQYESQGKSTHIDEDGFVTLTVKAISVRSN